MILLNLNKQMSFIGFILLTFLPAVKIATTPLPIESNQVITKDDLEWRIGGKIHFEEESGTAYIGIKDINMIVKNVLKEHIHVDCDICSENAKILLIRENNEIQMTHFMEKSRPGIGEEMHATLLYTQSRGFCSSETLKQVCESLFETCDCPPTIESVATKYSSIIKPEWKFEISEVVLAKSTTGTSFIIAMLHFQGLERLFNENKPISAGLHITLAIFDDSIVASHQITDLLVNEINLAIKGKMIKIAMRNDVADLEFGISGTSWRIRAGERIP
jgi:hypothetical protein